MSSQILVIEGSATEALRTKLILQAQGFQVRTATDAGAGLESARQEPPDLIVLATMIPGMTGYELWEQLKEQEATASVPVLMLTQVAGPAQMPPTQSLVAANFCQKPCDPADLVAHVQGLLMPESAALQPEAGGASCQEIERLRHDLEAARQAKHDFLATMSHELRTPLHEIMGMTELVLGTELDDQQREYLDKAKSSAEGLLARITDMIQFSEIQTGKVGLDNKRFDLFGIVGKTMALALPQAEEKGIDLDWDLDPSVPRYLVGDGERLRQVLTNLLDNAVKFTAAGEIRLHVTQQHETAQSVTLAFSVRDTGVGIPADKQAAIFGAFELADASTTRVYGGMGLGLAMSHAIVGAMGGKISLQSVVGQGSTFAFTVQMEREQPAVAAKQAIKLEELNILLAEDSPTNQLLARVNLGKAGHQVQVANNGLEAVQAHTDGTFDLILMDVAMPQMDGLEATRAIRANEQKTGQHVPIIAMTAFAMSDYRDKCFEAGMDGYVTKPVGAAALHQAIEEYLAQLADQDAAPAQDDLPVDLASALETAGGDAELLEAVVDISLDECDRLMTELDQAIAAQNSHALEHVAHTIKGTVANIGSGPAKELAQILETMGSQGTCDGAAEAARNLQPEITRLVSFYRNEAWQTMLPVLEGES